jgi:hypothetical protein
MSEATFKVSPDTHNLALEWDQLSRRNTGYSSHRSVGNTRVQCSFCDHRVTWPKYAEHVEKHRKAGFVLPLSVPTKRDAILVRCEWLETDSTDNEE